MEIGAHWRELGYLLRSHTVRWGRVRHPETGRECNGVLFIGTVDITGHLRGFDPVPLRCVRQLIDLLRLLAASDPAQFVFLIKKKVKDSKLMDQQSELMDAIVRKVPVDVKIDLMLFCNHRFSGFTPGVSDFFANKTTATAQRQGPFDKERQRLVALLTDSQCQSIQSQPVQVKLSIIMKAPENRTSFDAEDMFTDLTRFAADVKRISAASNEDASIKTSAFFLPVALERIKLTLRDIWITPEVVKRATDLMASGAPVKLCDIDIHPGFVQCSEQELRQFLGELTAVESKLHVSIGHRRDRGVEMIDKRDQDRTALLRKIANAVISLPSLHTLDIARLLSIVKSATNRRVIFQELLVPIMTRTNPLPVLNIGATTLSQDDVDSFRAAADELRRVNPGKLLRVKSLVLSSRRDNSERLHALTAGLDDAEDVQIQSFFPREPITSTAVRSVLRFPSLKKLDVQDCIIDTMDIFDPLIADFDLPVKPVLRSLHLERFVLRNQQSMWRFLQLLEDAAHPLSKSLQSLILDADWYSEELYCLDYIDVGILTGVLRSNRILATVRVGLPRAQGNLGLPDTEVLRRGLESTCDRRVAEVDGHEADITKARNRAFLSVVKSDLPAVPSACRRMDAGVLSLVFGYSAPYSSRTVSVHVVRAQGHYQGDY